MPKYNHSGEVPHKDKVHEEAYQEGLRRLEGHRTYYDTLSEEEREYLWTLDDPILGQNLDK